MSDRGQPTHASPDPTPTDPAEAPATPTSSSSTGFPPEPPIDANADLPATSPTPTSNHPAAYAPANDQTTGYAPASDQPAAYSPANDQTTGYAPANGQIADRHLELSADDTDNADESPFRLTAPVDEPTPAAAPANRRTRTIVLSSLLVAALAGAVTIGWFGWQVNTQRQTNLSTPTKIGTLALDDSEEATATADYLQSALSAEISMTKAVGAVYTDSAEKSVLFFGGTTLLWSPESDLDSAFSLVSDDQGAVTNLHEVDAGPLGGTMKCGVTTSSDGDMTVCGWADHGSLALAMFPNRLEPEAAPLMRTLRSAIQTRN